MRCPWICTDFVEVAEISPLSRGAYVDGVKKELEDPDGPIKPVNSLISLCMHQWTVKADTLKHILDNYVQVISTLVRCLDDSNFRKSLDASHSAEVTGMLNQYQSFSFFFALHTCICLFQVIDKYSKMIQSNDVTVSSAVYMIKC
jgi:hypothetical protein